MVVNNRKLFQLCQCDCPLASINLVHTSTYNVVATFSGIELLLLFIYVLYTTENSIEGSRVEK